MAAASSSGFHAVILAGGQGTRLAPYTFVLPKPLLPVAERPILEIVLERLRAAGCGSVTLSVGYLSHLIETYCGAGAKWGIAVDYFREDEPLGTVGSLALMEDLPDDPFIVMNGDVLTDLDIGGLLKTHAASDAELTIAGYTRTVKDELGVIEVDAGDRVVGYLEKPEHAYLVSMGVYAFSPSALDLIPRGERFDFPDLVHRLIAEGRDVRVAEHHGSWLDIGRPDDFERANRELRNAAESD